MTPNHPPDGSESARTAHALALAYARRPGANDRHKPTRRQQMLYAVTYTVEVLEEAAAGDVDPDRLRLAAAGLTAAAQRLAEPKPRRQSRSLPRPGQLPEAGRDVTLEQLRAATAAAAALTATLARTGHAAQT